jgi:hypothetical protein
MLDRSLEAEFEGYRKILPTNEARRSFDERIDAEAIRVRGSHSNRALPLKMH